MKINIIFPEFGLSGGVLVALRYAKALNDFGHDVMCYAKRLPYIKPRTIKEAIHAAHRLVKSYDAIVAQERCWKFNYKVPYLINDRTIRDADVVIATAWCTAYDVNSLSSSKGRKYYFIQDYEIWDDEKRGIASYKLPLKHIVIANWIDRILVDKHGCDKSTIIYNGIDLSVFKPNNKRENKELVVLMLYHPLPKKGIKDGLAVLSDIHKVYPNIRIVMFGKTAFVDKPNYIEYFKDPKPELLVRLYQQSDIFLFPAIEEGWGLTVIEAMACGCAVVGTNTGCLLELGINYKNAMISEPGKPDDLRNNLETIIIDKELREGISRNACETVSELAWEKSYCKFEKAIMD